MTETEIQALLGKMIKAALNKGLSRPNANATINFEECAHVYFYYTNQAGTLRSEVFYSEKFADGTIQDAFGKAFSFIDKIPSIEDQKKQEFLEQLAKTLDIGRKHGIDMAFINPLEVMMKDLSENALTFQEVH